jgi:hypothetical protein
MNWQQEAGMMYAGGNSSMLRGWSLRQEKCTVALPTQTDSCITSMASDESIPGMLVAGFGDGTLRLFDSRSRPDYAVKTTMKEHTSWVVQTHIYAGRNELLTGSVTGELKFWDLRYPKNSVKSLEAHRSPMTALAVHDYAPIFARYALVARSLSGSGGDLLCCCCLVIKWLAQPIYQGVPKRRRAVGAHPLPRGFPRRADWPCVVLGLPPASALPSCRCYRLGGCCLFER